MLLEATDKLIEVPDYLYRNPPKPRREDIARLFSNLVGNGRKKKFYIYRNDFEGIYRVLGDGYSLGVLKEENSSIYRIISLLYGKLLMDTTYIIIDPLDSKYLKIILNALNIRSSEKLELKIVKKKGRSILRMVFY